MVKSERLLIASLLAVLIGLNVFGQATGSPPPPSSGGGDTVMQGRVYLPDGSPPGRALRVELRGPRASNESVDTDSNGIFWFRSLTPGEYTINVNAGEEFEPVAEKILVDSYLRIAAGRSQGNSPVISIYLKPRRAAAAPAAAIDPNLAEVPRKASDFYQGGLSLLAFGKLEAAVTEFQKAIEIFPPFYQAHIELGKIHLKPSQFNDAIVAFQTALKYVPDSYAARLHLGMSYLNKKEFALAEEQLVIAAQLDKTAVTPGYYIGVIRYETNNIDGALAAFEWASQLNGNKPFPFLHKYLAGVYLKKNRWALAATELETYLAQAPDAKDAATIRTTIEELRSKPN